MITSPSAPQHGANPKRAYRMAAGLLGISTLHFVAPKPFDDIVPAELPGNPRYYTYASGVAEMTVAGLLAAPKTRRIGALAAVVLFVAVFPANVNMVRLWKDKPLPMRLVAIARLPLQIPMILQAWRVYRESSV